MIDNAKEIQIIDCLLKKCARPHLKPDKSCSISFNICLKGSQNLIHISQDRTEKLC